MREHNLEQSKILHEMIILRYEPIAIKLIKSEDEIPQDAIRPKRDMGKHIALCQAFAMTRRNLKTIYLDKNDHWCWNPLIGLGHVSCDVGTKEFEIVCHNLGIEDMEKAGKFFEKFPRLPLNENIGIVTAPLNNCDFEPDLTLIYSNNAQLRSLLWAIKGTTGKIVETQMDAIDSCIYALVLPLQNGEYRVTLPDIGEYERAMAGEDEIILSIPGGRMNELIDSLKVFEEHHMGYSQLSMQMPLDFARPPFYNDLFEIWGLDKGEDWDLI